MTKITGQQRFGTALMIGTAGGVVAVAISFVERHSVDDWGFIRVAFAGAFLAGFILARGFGGTGARGWFWSGVSFGLATVLGGIIAVLLMPLDHYLAQLDTAQAYLDLMRTSLLGPLHVIDVVSSQSGAALVWGMGLGGAHLAASQLRTEDPNL